MDPVYEIVGAYFSVRVQAGIPAHFNVGDQFGYMEFMGRMDLFVNAVTAAAVD